MSSYEFARIAARNLDLNGRLPKRVYQISNFDNPFRSKLFI